MRKKETTSVNVRSFNPTVNLIFNVAIATFAISCVVPFPFITTISLISEGSLAVNGYRFWLREFSLEAYYYIFQEAISQRIIHALEVTVFITMTGTIVNATITLLCIHVISRSSFPFKKSFTLFVLITILFSPGMVANYSVMANLLQLKDTIQALILSLALRPFNILVMRTFFKKIVPDDIIESARIDGVSEMRIFISIVLPLAAPGITTISLFTALGYWDDWFNTLLYIQKNTLIPLQYLLMKIQNNLKSLSRSTDTGTAAQEGLGVLPSESAQITVVVLSTLPVALTYPFFQEYSVGGLAIDGVEE